MDATLTRVATGRERRMIARLCHDRTRWDRMQASALVIVAVIAGYVPVGALVTVVAR